MADVVLDSFAGQVRGAIGRYPDPGDRYVFEFDSVRRRSVHMLGVRRALRVTWLVGEVVERREVLRPWLGFASARCDSIVEERP